MGTAESSPPAAKQLSRIHDHPLHTLTWASTGQVKTQSPHCYCQLPCCCEAGAPTKGASQLHVTPTGRGGPMYRRSCPRTCQNPLLASTLDALCTNRRADAVVTATGCSSRRAGRSRRPGWRRAICGAHSERPGGVRPDGFGASDQGGSLTEVVPPTEQQCCRMRGQTKQKQRRRGSVDRRRRSRLADGAWSGSV